MLSPSPRRGPGPEPLSAREMMARMTNTATMTSTGIRGEFCDADARSRTTGTPFNCTPLSAAMSWAKRVYAQKRRSAVVAGSQVGHHLRPDVSRPMSPARASLITGSNP